LTQCLKGRAEPIIAGLSALLHLPDAVSDVAVAKAMQSVGLAPAPLSAWYGSAASARPGLLLGIATAPLEEMTDACDRLCKVLDRF